MAKNNQFSQPYTAFHGRYLPEPEMQLAGYAALIAVYQLRVPLPERLSVVSQKHRRYEKDSWQVFTPRHTPDASLFGHLSFALKYEGVCLSVLKALFAAIEPKNIIEIVEKEPTGTYSRRIWFLYEWLEKTQLDLPAAQQGVFVDVLDKNLQYPGPQRMSKRHRVHNNLPGTSEFCLTVRRTAKLDRFIDKKLNKKVEKMLGAVHPDILTRASAFLLLKDSRASFEIEDETPELKRAERWGKAISEAGKHPLSDEEFLRLQEIVIKDFRMTHYGYRVEGGFVGEHDRLTGMPIPHHISARPEDLHLLMDGLIETDILLNKSEFDAVLMAAIIAFGFVYIHPFEDGNGRIHRYLIHHVLAEKGFITKEIIFPVSAVILERIEEYRTVLESYSKQCLDLIQWRPTEKGNVDVFSETIDFYRYFDVTKHAEFLYDCIKETIYKTLPEEIDYLRKYELMKQFVANYIEMPDRVIDLLIRFLRQGDGKFSKRAKEKEFSSLTDKEITVLENKFSEIFYHSV